MRPTRVRELIALALLAVAVTWLLVRVFYGSLPPIPGYAGASLYPVAVVEFVLGWVVRARIADRGIGDGRGRLHPIVAARAVVLAKASALLGAGTAGVWAGFLLHVVPQRSFSRAASGDTLGAVVGLVAALLLVAAALWLEYCCRTPDDPDENLGEPAV